MDAELRELCERLRNAADKAEETCDAETDPNCTFLPFTIASMRTMLEEAADTIAAQAAELEGVRAMLEAAPVGRVPILRWAEVDNVPVFFDAPLKSPALSGKRVRIVPIDTAIADSGSQEGK